MHPKTDGGAETCAYPRGIFVRLALPAVLAVVLSACGGGDADAPADLPVAAESPTPVASGEPIPLGCEHVVPQPQIATPRGLIVPRDVRVIAGSRRKRPDDPRITVVEGYVERVPSQLVKAFQGQKGVKILFTEDEEFEAELLVSDGKHRAFWKVVRACLAASRFTALFSTERAGEAVAGAAPPTKKPVRRR
jgi:hypothetical protein